MSKKYKFIAYLIILTLVLTSFSACDKKVHDKFITYDGVAKGYNGNLSVSVSFNENEIIDIKILDHNETEGFSGKAFKSVPKSILETQSLDVDIVTGATVTSKAIVSAVIIALENGGVDPNTFKSK